ncbi:2-isopropylmalate synthase [Planctomycetota bacterium]
MGNEKEQVLIFDTTLRDGEQSPGASLMKEEKFEIAKKLAELGVDIIEAGFPISSPGDFSAVQQIAQDVDGPIIAGLARALKGDIESCWEAVKDAKKPRIHTFVGTSPVHREGILRKSADEVASMAVEAVKIAKELADDVEFSAMDATRTELDYLCEVIERCIEAGATTVNIPDTVGYAVPGTFGALVKDVCERVPNIGRAVVSVHCHNDLGLAAANSVASVENGARQIECAVNGIGERAGNASLEEVVMIIETRKDVYEKVTTGINTKHLWPTSKLVSQLTGIPVQPNKPIVGANAFAHSSGIHQDGILKQRQTFEIMNPESVGVSEHQIVLTSRSGRHALKKRLEELGYVVADEVVEQTYAHFLELADKKKEVFDEDLHALMGDERGATAETYHLTYVHAVTGNKTIPTATVIIEKEDKQVKEAACGDGPVDACYKAIDRATGLSPKLRDYSLKAVTAGKDAQGEVSVLLECNGRTFIGRGASTDIIEASAKAYLRAVNRIIAAGVDE